MLSVVLLFVLALHIAIHVSLAVIQSNGLQIGGNESPFYTHTTDIHVYFCESFSCTFYTSRIQKMFHWKLVTLKLKSTNPQQGTAQTQSNLVTDNYNEARVHWMRQKIKKKLWLLIPTQPAHCYCSYTYFTVCDTHILQMDVYCCKTVLQVSQYNVRNYFLYFVKFFTTTKNNSNTSYRSK